MELESKELKIKEDDTKALGSDEYTKNEDISKVKKTRILWTYLGHFSAKVESFGVETRGIERVEPYERSQNVTKQLISVIGLWLSACGGLSSMSTFLLGPLLFELGLRKSLLAGLIGETVGCAVAAYCSLMGPKSGCRQMVSARFLFGWWFVKLVSLVSIIGVMGWSVVNSVVGGQILRSVSNDTIPLVVGIIIVAVISLLVAIGGIKHLLKVETLLSIPVFTAFLLLYIVSASKFKMLSNLDGEGIRGMSETIKGNWISYFSLSYSTTSTWGSLASDYYILFPEDTPEWRTFLITFFGILIPTTFVGVLGTLIGNIGLSFKPWGDVYEEYGMGGLLHEAFRPWGAGGKLVLMIIFLSLISNNIVNTYSAAFGVQLAGVGFSKIPRWVWAIIMTGIYLVCALVGRNKFSTILGNFLPMIGYWLSMYFIMLFEENCIFRTSKFISLYTKEFSSLDEDGSEFLITDNLEKDKKSYYNFKIWNDYHKLTMGLASTSSFIIGASGAALGMSQAYWVGPLARLCGGEYGGDIAMWLCMGFSGIAFPPLRYLELVKFGR